MTGADVLFGVFAALACGGAIGVAACRSVARMAFALVVCLSAVAGLFFLLNAPLVGATQLIVYVGGTVVLLIFGVMLTDAGVGRRMKIGLLETIFTTLVAAGLLAALGWTAVGLGRAIPGPPTFAEDRTEVAAATPDTLRPVGLKFLGFGGASRTGFLLPFEIISVHLLVVLIGAAYLARAKRRVDPEADATRDTASDVSGANP
ncbi:NADH-quinone oxidoreductase subunit J family protein [Alienimonas californiensis]|uniref:NADH-quinone oxidoreductase subunit J n=1 Tax=Alienimonas californiensis TaxID=2527989 RepID=A0A517P9Y1_9PLAN|nr:NADH-quinone oxidoreductase subunit J [Alienimonas californiensis]QDT16179.1 NADH:ubiquinone oxidoreductase subunit J [Alienimonas californiensis]